VWLCLENGKRVTLSFVFFSSRSRKKRYARDRSKITKKRYAQITKKRDRGGKCQCRGGGSVNADGGEVSMPYAPPAYGGVLRHLPSSRSLSRSEKILRVWVEREGCGVRCVMNAFFSPSPSNAWSKKICSSLQWRSIQSQNNVLIRPRRIRIAPNLNHLCIHHRARHHRARLHARLQVPLALLQGPANVAAMQRGLDVDQ
jgi:hypothetical protein